MTTPFDFLKNDTVTAGTAPTIQSVTFDKSSYTPGMTVTVTVKYTAGTSVQTINDVGTATITDTESNEEVTATGNLTIEATVTDPSTPTFSDTGNHTWTLSSESTPGTAIFTTTA